MRSLQSVGYLLLYVSLISCGTRPSASTADPLSTRLSALVVDEEVFEGLPLELLADFRIVADYHLWPDETDSIQLDVHVDLEAANLLTFEPESLSFAARNETLIQVLNRMSDLLELDYEICNSQILFCLREPLDLRRSLDQEEPRNGSEGLPAEVVEAVLAHRLSSGPFDRPFSVVSSLGFDPLKVALLGDASLERVLWSSLAKRGHFIPPSRLLLSGFGVESRTDSEGRAIEGILDRDTGEAVFVLHVVGWIQMSKTEWEVVTEYYHGPLAAGGQSYRVVRVGYGFRIRRGSFSWLS